MSDAPEIVRYSAHPSILRAIDWKTPDGRVTEESVAKFIRKQNKVEPGGSEWFDLAVALKPNDKVIGTIGIMRKEHKQGRTGWGLAAEHRGQGLATEAALAMLEYGFQDLGCHRIDAVTSQWNERSWKLMERIGMRREAHFREREFARGEWQDVVIYALLKSEWAELSRP